MKTKGIGRFLLGLVIVVYFAMLFSAVFADDVLWTADGEVVCNVTSADKDGISIASDSSGNSLTVWSDNRSGDYNILIQKVDSDGTPLLGAGSLICSASNDQTDPYIIYDGSNYIVIWQDDRNGVGNNDIYAQKIDTDGSALWTLNGVSVTEATYVQEEYQLVSDGSDGAIIVWNDERKDNDIYAQRLDSSGNRLWSDDGIDYDGIVISETSGFVNESPQIISDSCGGAIIVWTDNRLCWVSGSDIYAQRIDSDGNVCVGWTANGNIVSDADEDQLVPQLCSDDSDGAIITWQDARDEITDYNIYAQRINSDGAIVWGDDVCIADQLDDQEAPGISAASDGSAVILWRDRRDGNNNVYIQKIDTDGNPLWEVGNDGVLVCDSAFDIYYRPPQHIYNSVYDEVNVVWIDPENAYNDVYAQQYDSSGNPLLGVDGLAICTAGFVQQNSKITVDATCGAIIVWEDNRAGNQDIYTQRLGVDSSPPEIIPAIGDHAIDEADTLTFTVNATDPDVGDTVTYSQTGLPGNVIFNPVNGNFEWTPAYDQSGVYSATFTAEDNNGLIDFETVEITVNNVNRAPVMAPVSDVIVDEGDNVNFIVTASDPDGTIPVLTAINLPAGAVFTDNGNGTGTFDWTPTYEQDGIYTITLTATDDGALFDSETPQITVNNVNGPPVIDLIPDTSVDEGDNLNFTVTAIDPDGTIPALTATNLPAGAVFTDHGNGTGTFDWTPTYEQDGDYNVTFTAIDGGGLSDSTMPQIAVGDVNRTPVMDIITDQGVDEGDNLSFVVTASDPDGTIPALAVVDLATVVPGAVFTDHGNGTGTFDWTPTYEQDGDYNVTFTATDGGGLSDSTTPQIAVSDVNRAPIIDPISDTSVDEGDNLSFIVTASDPDGTIPVLTVTNLPAGAVFTDNGNGTGTFDWTPTYEQDGDYNVTFTATDGGGLSDLTIPQIAVGDVNRAPVLDPIVDQTVEEGSDLLLSLSAVDPDTGDTVTYSSTVLPSGASLDTNTGIFSWTTVAGQAGDYNITFTASDGSLTDSETITITCNGEEQGEEEGAEEDNQTRWYLAEGSTRNYITYILVVNPGEVDADIEITFMNEQAQMVTVTDTIGAHSRETYLANDYMPDELGISTTVECINEQPIVVERAMYWHTGGMERAGGHDNVGQTQAYTTLYLAEGSTAGFETFVLIQNPGPDTAQVEIIYMDQDGITALQTESIAGYSRFTQKINAYEINDVKVMDNKDGVSTKIESTNGVPVIAERSMYWDFGSVSRIGGHCASGVPQADTEWFLAEGSTNGFELWILVMNPGSEAALCRATFMLIDGSTIEREFWVGPTSRFSIGGHLVEDLSSLSAVSTKIESLNGIPVIAERAMYWDSDEIIRAGGHCNSGSNSDTDTVYFAEGYTGGSFSEWICIQNPNDNDSVIEIQFMLEDGSVITDNIMVLAHSRYTVNVNSYVSGVDVSAVLNVSNGVGIIAERAMYWDSVGINTSGVEQTYEWIGGHCSGRNN